MAGILPAVSIQDVPEDVAPKYTAVGTVGTVTTREIKEGYVQVSIPLEGTASDGSEKRITARFNVRPEWFDAGFEKSEDYAGYADNQRFSYQINMKKLARGVFAAAGLTTMDFDTLEGATVGFTVGPQSKDKSRQEVKGFYSPKR